MKLLINTHNKIMAIDVNDGCGQLLKELASARLYDEKWEETGTRLVPSGTDKDLVCVSIEIAPDEKFSQATPALDAALQAMKVSESRWLEYYNKFNAAEKELKELKAKIEQINGKVVV